MSSLRFVQFTEINDHEGETWHSWLQVDGNEEQLAKLRTLLAAAEEAAEYELEYTLTENVEPQYIVDKLVQYADCGYSRTHNKVTGEFTCPDDLGANEELLYKGGVSDFFKS